VFDWKHVYLLLFFSIISCLITKLHYQLFVPPSPRPSKRFSFVGASKCLGYLESFSGLLQLPLTKTEIEKKNPFFLEVTLCFGKQCSTIQKYRDAFTFMPDPDDEGITSLRKHLQILAPKTQINMQEDEFFAERPVVTSFSRPRWYLAKTASTFS
jgi:hypothetical protein